jgi:hypothetical protein
MFQIKGLTDHLALDSIHQDHPALAAAVLHSSPEASQPRDSGAREVSETAIGPVFLHDVFADIGFGVIVCFGSNVRVVSNEAQLCSERLWSRGDVVYGPHSAAIEQTAEAKVCTGLDDECWRYDGGKL